MDGKRFWEIDFARGIAVLAMIVFHALFDLNYFAGYSFELSHGFWLWFARATAAAFVFLAGGGLYLSYSRSKQKGFAFVSKKFLLRGAKIFALGLFISLATFLFLEGRGTIWFGVLHFVGAAVILSLAFVRHPRFSALAGLAAISLGIYFDGLTVDAPYLFWLGLKFPGFYSYDHFPIFPWLGVVLLGVGAGETLYRGGQRVFQVAEPRNYFVGALAFAGRNSLLIYLAHQPLLIAAILALKKFVF